MNLRHISAHLSAFFATLALSGTASAGELDNLQLMDGSVALHSMQIMVAPGAAQDGRTVFFNDRSKQLGSDYVPADPRRGGRTEILYATDLVDGATASGLSAFDTTQAIDRAMATWDGVRCSDLPIVNRGALPVDLGLLEFALTGGAGGFPGVVADITHAGFGALPAGVLPPNVIAATFTFMFIDPATGGPSDVDGNGKVDTAFTEIYYSNTFPWQIDDNVDVETVALHESGHALSQDHFGAGFATDANGKVHLAPAAVMNAIYGGVRQSLRGTDLGGHCSIWGSWPQN